MISLNKKNCEDSLQLTLGWFENSGVMFPADGSWGVAERIVLKKNNSKLEKIKLDFPPWTEKEDYLVLEQRRADCAIQTAFLYSLSAEIFHEAHYLKIASNLLEFLFCRSGLLRTSTSPDELPVGLWHWSHSRRYHQYYFDDNSWVCTLLLMMAQRHPEFEHKFQLRKWAMELANAMAEIFPRYFSGETSETEIKGDMKWLGNLFKPHWGSLLVMALSRAYEFRANSKFREIVDNYHNYLLKNPEIFNTSEWAYAVIGASFARHAFHDDKSVAVMKLFGSKLTSSMQDNGLIPSQHSAEAPAGDKLADLVYTMNFAALAFVSLAAFDPGKFQNPFKRLMTLLLQLQDRSPEPHLHGCYRGMFDFERDQWGGGNCSEGGAASIYTGWTNAPIGIAVAGILINKSLESM